MNMVINPITGQLDCIGLTQDEADDLYVSKTGDIMSGDLEFTTGESTIYSAQTGNSSITRNIVLQTLDDWSRSWITSLDKNDRNQASIGWHGVNSDDSITHNAWEVKTSVSPSNPSPALMQTRYAIQSDKDLSDVYYNYISNFFTYKGDGTNTKTFNVDATTGNTHVLGYMRVGSTSAPNNTTAGDFTAVRLSIGNAAFGTAGRAARFTITDTTTASGANTMVGVVNTLQPASDSAAEYRAIYFQNLLTAATGIQYTASSGVQGGYFENRVRSDGLINTLKGISVTGISADSSSPATIQATTVKGIDLIGWNRPSGTTTATVGTFTGYDTNNMFTSGGMTVTTATAFRVGNPVSGNTIGTFIGLDVTTLTRATTNIGVRIARPTTGTTNYALQLSDTGGTADGGITYGTDTTLYRSAVSTLKTDGKLHVGGELELDGALNHDGANVGFFGTAPATQQTELTDELTPLTSSAPGTPDYAIQDLVNAGGYGFVTLDEALTVLSVVKNINTRVNELETKLVAYGLLVDAD